MKANTTTQKLLTSEARRNVKEIDECDVQQGLVLCCSVAMMSVLSNHLLSESEDRENMNALVLNYYTNFHSIKLSLSKTPSALLLITSPWLLF